ncbi:ROK family protein [Streptacidiphilus sp. PB12-B1b]|uniref:ROK family protein n=1 Tax=Streptacidiphilus sp. PB12-B1b TaxID=2705012 RepID=UPI0015FD31F3|nr:ROK family protein [Streptacidiphilus sp. PB12-B1b]QMU77704.1 ROK family protein [Streptacidiphilus sp. PB12-B1b]
MSPQQSDATTSGVEPSAGLVAALDIGGTKIAGGLVDAAGELLFQVQRPTPARESGEAVLKTVHEVLDLLAADPRWAGVDALGIGSAGPVDISRGTVSPINIPGWRDYPLVRQTAAHPAAAGLPIVLGGDGVAMAAAEHWRGAARGYDNALCLVVSTGVGAGLVLNGAVHPGRTGNAGHLGHISVDLDGDPCPCGSRGCLEGLASGTAIARRAQRDGWRPGPAADGTADASAGAVAAAALAGDRIAVAAFDRAAQALAAGIAATATLVEIDVAVIGGGVSRAGEVLFAPLRRHLADYAPLPFTAGVRVLPAQLGTDAGLVGAAALAIAGRRDAAGAAW